MQCIRINRGRPRFLTEQCMEDCIPHWGQVYNGTLMVEQHWDEEVHALGAGNRYAQRLLAVHGTKRPVEHLTDGKREACSRNGHLCFWTAASCDPEFTGIQFVNKSDFSHGSLATKSNRQRSWNVAITLRQRISVCFFSRWDFLRTQPWERIWVLAEKGARCMCNRTWRQRQHHHLF